MQLTDHQPLTRIGLRHPHPTQLQPRNAHRQTTLGPHFDTPQHRSPERGTSRRGGAAGGVHHRTLTTARAHPVNPLTGVRPYRALTGLRAREPGRPWTPPTAPERSPQLNGTTSAPQSTRQSASGSRHPPKPAQSAGLISAH
jgi:hypothetical protein